MSEPQPPQEPPRDRPDILDYRSNKQPTRSTTTAIGEMAMGATLWIAAEIFVYVVLIPFKGGTHVPLLYLVPIGAILAVLGVSMWAHNKKKWKSFMPGVVLAMSLSCLVPIGLAVVTCGSMKL